MTNKYSSERKTDLERVVCNFCESSESKRICAYGETEIVKCTFCGQAYRNPRLNECAGKEVYECDYYEKYQGIEKRIAGARRDVFKENLSYLAKKLGSPSRRILDVGCGQGHFLKLANDAGWEVHGNDLSKSACSFALREFGIHVKNAKLEDIGFPDRYFDVVTFWNVLDHLYNPLQALQEAQRILKPGGILFIRVPNMSFHLFLYRVYRVLGGLLRGVSPRQPFVFVNYSFTSSTLKASLERSGFRDIIIRNSPLTAGDPYQTFSLSSHLVNFLKKLYGLFSCIVYYLSAKKIYIAPSLIAFAVK